MSIFYWVLTNIIRK